MRRREFIAGLGGAVVWPLASGAQQRALPVIGFLSSQREGEGTRIGFTAAFLQGLGEQGYVDGRNVEILYRWAEGQTDRLPALAADLVRRRVALIATPGGGTAAALAAKLVTATIPIVFAVGADPVELGLVASLSRPGGNLTGATRIVQELVPKYLELLHKAVPAAISIGFLVDPQVPYMAAEKREAERVAPGLGVSLVVATANTPSEIERALATLVGQQIGALLVGASASFFDHRDQLVALVARHALPAIYISREFVDAGGLMSYGAKALDADRLAGSYAARILKGEKPADLPVQRPAKFGMVLNLKTATALGLTIPSTLLALADEVIE